MQGDTLTPCTTNISTLLFVKSLLQLLMTAMASHQILDILSNVLYMEQKGSRLNTSVVDT